MAWTRSISTSGIQIIAIMFCEFGIKCFVDSCHQHLTILASDQYYVWVVID